MAKRLVSLARVDFAPSHQQPSALRVLIASVAAIVGSLLADAIIVVIACIAWPIVTRLCSAPRWLFFRLAILVTLVLLLPDVYIWDKGNLRRRGAYPRPRAAVGRDWPVLGRAAS